MVRKSTAKSHGDFVNIPIGVPDRGDAHDPLVVGSQMVRAGKPGRVVSVLVSSLYRYALSAPALSLTALAFVLRFINLGAENLWFDEAFTWVGIQPQNDLLGGILGDVHPPLWVVWQALVGRFLGYSEWAFRASSGALGVASVSLLYVIARRLGFEKRTAYTVGLLACLSPGLIYFSQDGRMYSMLLFFVLLALYTGLRGNWIGFVIAGAGAMYTQNIGVIYIGLIALGMFIRRPKLIALVSGAGALAIWLPWSPVVLQQSRYVAGGYWTPAINPGSFLYPFIVNTIQARIPHQLEVAATAGFFALTIFSLIACYRWLYTRRGLMVILPLIGAPAALALYSELISPAYVWRAMLPSGALLLLLWGYTLHHLGGFNRGIARAMAGIMLGVSLIGYYSPVLAARNRPDLARIMEPIRSQWQVGDHLYFINPTSAIAYLPYLKSDETFSVLPLPDTIMNITVQARRAFNLPEGDIPQGRSWVIGNIIPFSEEIELWTIRKIALDPHTVWVQPPRTPQEMARIALMEFNLFDRFIFLVNR